MNNPIEDMAERLSKRFRGPRKPLEGFKITEISPTRNNAPRLPQSTIPSPKPRYERAGRPSKGTDIYKAPELYRKKPRDIFGGWL